MRTASAKGTTMTNPQDKLDWGGRKMVDQDGDKIGTIDEIYVDQDTGNPEWALVNTGMFGTSSNFVPLADASAKGDEVMAAHTKDTVKDAPQLGEGQELSRDDEAELYRYYGIESDVASPPQDATSGDQDAALGDQDATSGTDSMVRSEEEVTVGTTTRSAGGLRLRKHVVTEQETVTVPVSHEEAHVTREPISDDEAARSGDTELSEESVEVTLTEEVPTVDTKVVAKEQIGVDTETVEEQQEVSADVRKEQVEVVEDDDDGRN